VFLGFKFSFFFSLLSLATPVFLHPKFQQSLKFHKEGVLYTMFYFPVVDRLILVGGSFFIAHFRVFLGQRPPGQHAPTDLGRGFSYPIKTLFPAFFVIFPWVRKRRDIRYLLAKPRRTIAGQIFLPSKVGDVF